MAQQGGIKIVAKNPKAYHEYYVMEKYEAGIELFGTEVKSVRGGNISRRKHGVPCRMGNCFSSRCTLRPMPRGAFPTGIPCGPSGF